MAKKQRPSMRDRIREQAQNSTTEGASYLKLPKKLNFFSPKADEYELDVIPFENTNANHPKGYEVGELVPFVRFKIHAGIGAEDRKYVCPTSIGKACPICNERNRMAKNSNSDPDLIKALQPKDRMLFLVIDLKEEKKGVQIFDHSYFLFGKKLLADIDRSENSQGGRRRSTAHAGFAELEGGQTLIATFIEKKMGSNKFYECDRIDAEDRDNYDESILDDTVNLDDCLKVLDYAALEAIFLELDPEEQGSSRKREEKEEPKSKRSKKEEVEDDDEPAPSRRRGKVEEVEEEAPVRKRSAKKEEAEEDEPAPPTRRGRKAEPEAEEDEPAPTRRGKKEVVEEEEEAPVRRRGKKEVVEDDDNASKCWVKGGVFGRDCDKHLEDAPAPNCYDCPEDTWKDCKAAQMKMNK